MNTPLVESLANRLEQNVISLARWFNEPLLSDVQIFVSREENTPSFYCNTTLLRRRSPKLVASLERPDRRLNTDSDNNSSIKKVLIVEELEGKADLTQLFLRVLYDESAWDNDKCYPLLDVFTKYELYAFVWALTNKLPEEAANKNHFFELGRIIYESLPEANSDNIYDGDLLVKLKGTEYTYHCHSVVLANGLEYFQGLFRSGMKDSSAREVTIELHEDVTPAAFKIAFDSLLHYVYRGFLKSVPSQEAFVVTYALAVKYVAAQLEAELTRKIPFVCSTKTIGPVIYNAFKYEAQTIVDKATDILIPKFTQSAAEDSFRQVPKEYLLQFRAGTPLKNAIQYALDSQLDSLIVKALDNILAIIGDDPTVNVNVVDDKNNTLLHLCVNGAPRPHTVEYLIKKGLKINAQNNAGLTPMGVVLSQVGKTEFELQHAMAQLLIAGATFDETKPDLVRAFLALAAQFDFKNELFQNAWPAAQKIINQLPSILKVFVDDFGQKTLDLALSCKCLPMVDYLIFKVGLPTGRQVSILNHDNDNVPRAWYPEHDHFAFCVESESVFKLDKKNYSMKGAEIFASEQDYGSGSYEVSRNIFDQLTVHIRDRRGHDKPLEFNSRRSPEWQRFLNLLQFMWVKSNVPEERQNVAFTAPVKEGHLPTSEEIKQGLGNTGDTLKAFGQLMSGLNLIVKK